MNLHLPAPRRRWPARLVNLAVVVVVLALAAATFVFSYTGVHAIALQAGVSARLARVYPGTFDAVLVIACVAAVTLRDARWWIRSYAWGSIIVVVAVVGAGDAAHAMNVALPHRTMEGVVAATPWVLVLLGFSLMLTMLRHSRAHHAAAASPDQRASGRAAKRPAGPAGPAARPAEAEIGQPELAVRPAPAPGLSPAPPGAQESTDSGAGADTGEPAPATAPDHVLETGGSALFWEDYWDTSGENAPHEDPHPAAAAESGDQRAPSAAAESGDQRAPSAAAESGDQRAPSAAAESGDPANRLQSAAMAAGDDAPPFAAAPFASAPRLNRVRSTPTPPEDDEE